MQIGKTEKCMLTFKHSLSFLFFSLSCFLWFSLPIFPSFFHHFPCLLPVFPLFIFLPIILVYIFLSFFLSSYPSVFLLSLCKWLLLPVSSSHSFFLSAECYSEGSDQEGDDCVSPCSQDSEQETTESENVSNKVWKSLTQTLHTVSKPLCRPLRRSLSLQFPLRARGEAPWRVGLWVETEEEEWSQTAASACSGWTSPDRTEPAEQPPSLRSTSGRKKKKPSMVNTWIHTWLPKTAAASLWPLFIPVSRVASWWDGKSVQPPEGSQPVSDRSVLSEGLQSVIHQTLQERQSQREAAPAQDPQQHVKGQSERLSGSADDDVFALHLLFCCYYIFIFFHCHFLWLLKPKLPHLGINKIKSYFTKYMYSNSITRLIFRHLYVIWCSVVKHELFKWSQVRDKKSKKPLTIDGIKICASIVFELFIYLFGCNSCRDSAALQ